MGKFSKRTYNSISEFINDIKFILKNRSKIKALDNGQLINKEFQERLMLAVTAVNGCRYCSYYHTKIALEVGISSQELAQLLDGSLMNSPEEEKIALLYAQHWAEQSGYPEQDFIKKLAKTYEKKQVDAINLAIRTINFGNLMGNTFDYFLYKISFGHLGTS